jgi:hypothetical protein
MGLFSVVTFVLALTRPKEERYGATLRALAGITTPLLATVAYFYYHSALDNLLDGVVLFNALYLTRDAYTTTPLIFRVLSDPSNLWGPVSNIVLPYITMLGPIIIGLVMLIRLYFLRPYQYRFAPILLSFPGPPLWALIDFQLSDDFFVYLPYAAIGFGAFLASVIHRVKTPRLAGVLLGAVLLGVAIANTFEEINAIAAHRLLGTTIDLSQQREGASEIEERFGEDVRLASINSPQVLVLLHRKNPNPYLFITSGIDRYIDAKTPGGFEGWVGELQEFNPNAITFFSEGQSLLPGAHLTEAHHQKLLGWLNSRYQMEKIGPWWLYVRNPQ